MLSVLISVAFAIVKGRSPDFDDSFLIRVGDNNWTDIAQKYRDFFVFFHVDHARTSDIGYLRYLTVAKKHLNESAFMVCPGAFCDRVARAFRIPRFPSLFRVINASATIEMLGGMSTDSLDRFVSNFTASPYVDLEVENGVTVDDIMAKAKIDSYDESPIIFLLSDNTTRFGRMSLKFASDHLVDDYRLIRITNKAAADAFGVRFPSIVLVNQEDDSIRAYQGEPVVEKMMDWIKDNKAAKITSFRITDMHNKDGVANKIVLTFAKRSELSQVKKEMLIEADKYPRIKMAYADPAEQTRLFKLFELDESTKRVCIVSNFTWIGYNACNSAEDLAENKVDLKYIRTPRASYNFAAKTTEAGFNDLLKHGPVFVAFDLTGCYKCNQLAREAMKTAKKIAGYGSQANWVIWDVHKAVPTFREQLNLPVPSLWFFNSTDPSQAVQFNGKPEYLEMTSWANKVNKDFNLIKLLEEETKMMQYDSL